MAFDPSQRARQTVYQDTVINYFTKEKGQALTVSDDQAFCTQLRLTLSRELGVTEVGAITQFPNPAQMVRCLNELPPDHSSPLLFLERVLNGQDQSLLVKKLRQTFPNIKIIILTTEVPRERLLLFHELGADNVIAKPVSANTLIEKMAFTLKPQSRIGQAIDLARSLLQQKKYAAAQDACAKILALKPGSAAAYLLLGDTYRETGDFTKARTAYETAASSAELYLAPLQRLAELYEATGDKTRLKECLERLDELSPLNVDRKVSLGSVNLDLGNTEEAEEYFSKAMVQMQRDALEGISALSGRIADIYTERDPEKAEKYIRTSLEVKEKFLSRDDIALFNRLGLSLRRQGRWQDAVTEYRRALKLAPDDANLYYNLAMALAEGRAFPQAKAHMLKALEYNPQLPQTGATIAFNCGAVFLQNDDRSRAAAFFRQALEQNPDLRSAQEGLARAAG
ncbi:response regulator [uncultured Desulfovibrio sp.]|mgnify:CR=1 FL=1|uniref:response regulator n=1 Tax=Desulfovibrio legallii TaxID=571438 RepID=UPI002599052E|nr:response regulator [uncultured Desulfovibrio sp.]